MATAPTAPMVDAWPQVSTGQVTFYWRLPASDGGDAITKYTLSCAAISYSQDVSATRLDFTVTGLTDKTDYLFQITATNGVGASPAASFPIVQPGAIPFGPTVATASTLNESTAVVSWTPSTLATEGALRAYSVQVIPSTPAISSYFITMFPFKSTMAIAGLSTNTYYQFLVRGINDVGYCAPFAYTSTLGFGIVQTAFSPSSIGGMQLWLDAAQITGYSNSQAITSWTDRSPSPLSNTTSGSPSAPTYRTNQMNGLPIVRFNSGYINLGSTLQIGTDPGQSIFTVLKFNETGNDMAIIGRNNEAVGRWGVDRYQGLLRYYVHTPSGFAAAEFTNNNNVSSQILNVSWDRSVASMYINAELKKSNAFSSSDNIVNSSLLAIGAFIQRPSGGPIWYMNADVAETLYYNRGLTPFDRQKVEGYLAWKWGLTANLPATHPFKTAAPINTSVFSPSSFSTLSLWLDAADATTFTTSGGVISQWNDKSGRGYNVTQGTSSNQPTYSTSMVSLNSNRYFNIPQAAINNATQYCYFMVFTPNSGSNWITCKQKDGVDTMNVWSMTYYTQSAILTGSNGYMYYRTGNGNTLTNSGVALTRSNMQIITMAYTTTTSTLSMFVNGSTLTASNGNFIIPNELAANRFSLGAQVDGAGTIYNSGVTNFNLYEFGFYNGFVSTDDRQTVEGYLAWKWGLQGNLPLTHPYKYSNPASNYSGTVVPQGLLVRFDAPTYSGSGTWSNTAALGTANNASTLVGTPSKNAASNGVVLTGGLEYRLVAPSQQTSWTLSAWFKRTGNCDTNAAILCDVFAGGSLNMALGVNGTSANTFNGGFYVSGGGWRLGTNFTPPSNTWMHMCVAFNGSSFATYSNGTLIGTVTGITDVPAASGSGFYRINVNGTSVSGEVGQILIYNRAISAAEVAQNYAATSNVYTV